MAMTPVLRTPRLVLHPLHVSDAADMVPVLADESLYHFIGGSPPSLNQLRARYRAQVKGSPSPEQVWHNWIIRLDGAAVGYVQATVSDSVCDVAWVVGRDWQGLGIATEAAGAMCRWLSTSGVRCLRAHIHPDHRASATVASRLGFSCTSELDADGEVIWEWSVLTS